MSQSKVYILQEGCHYEGTGIRSVHKSKASALFAAEAHIRDTSIRIYQPTPEDSRYFGPGAVYMWNDDSDILLITEHKVL